MRYRRIREQALDLQSKIGKISFTEAMDSLVEAGWNAPLAKENPAIDTIMRTKKWDISSDKFPIFNPKIEEEKKDYSKYPNIVNPKTKGLEPSLIVGEDPITLDETEVIQFHHKQPNGEIYNHEESYISPDSLEKFIIIQIDENSQDFGNCWDREHCKGILYPQEIKGFVSDKTYNEYRQLFNWRFRFVREGGRRKTRKMCISARK